MGVLSESNFCLEHKSEWKTPAVQARRREAAIEAVDGRVLMLENS
jgi:hypothetical protein